MGNRGSKTEDQSESSWNIQEQNTAAKLDKSSCNSEGSRTNHPDHLPGSNSHIRNIISVTSASNIVHASGISQNVVERFMIHTSATVRAFGQKCCQAYITAIEALRKFDLKAFAVTIVQWVKQNPRQATFIMVCFVVSMLLVATMPLILGVVGFTPVGIAAGSIAAGIQASIGNVAAGSLFAFLTSAGMGGAAAPILGVFAPAASAGVMCLGKWLYDLVKNKIDEHKKRQEEMALMKRG